MYVKVCGVTSPEDAEEAVRLGVDAIGLNFWPGSARYVDDARAREIADAVRERTTLVGVFVDAPAEGVLETMAAFGLAFAQLHGHETPAACAALPRDRYYKALAATDASALERLAAYDCACFLLDGARADVLGGEGAPCDWAVAAAAARTHRIVLAGGLGPDDVEDAIRRVRPYGVDVARGVERRPGVKDSAKLARFVEAARRAAAT